MQYSCQHVDQSLNTWPQTNQSYVSGHKNSTSTLTGVSPLGAFLTLFECVIPAMGAITTVALWVKANAG